MQQLTKEVQIYTDDSEIIDLIEDQSYETKCNLYRILEIGDRKGSAIGYVLPKNGISVIVLIRFGTEYSERDRGLIAVAGTNTSQVIAVLLLHAAQYEQIGAKEVARGIKDLVTNINYKTRSRLSLTKNLILN